MKILYFSEQYGPHDYRFLSAIVEGGHQAFFLCLEPNIQKQEKRALPRDVKIVIGTVEKVISEVNPDLVHAGPLTTCSYLAAKTGFHPLVQMSWGSDILYDAKKGVLARRRVHTALRSADVLIADCAAVGDAAVKLGFPRKKIITFPWGVDVKRFNPSGGDDGLRKQLGWQKAFVLLHVRSWEPLYGAEMVLRAFLLAGAMQSNLRLLMPGYGSLATRLKEIVKKSGLSDRVHFAGPVAQRDLPTFYRAANLYVSASKSDGSSVSLMEALASGVPALVSDIPGNREWVRSGKEGWVFPLRDERGLADKLIKAAAKSNLVQKMGKQARATAVKRADWTNNKKQLFRGYQLALKKTKTS
jgi:glycosyltransferase involved in cell wall biosynthesis